MDDTASEAEPVVQSRVGNPAEKRVACRISACRICACRAAPDCACRISHSSSEMLIRHPVYTHRYNFDLIIEEKYSNL